MTASRFAIECSAAIAPQYAKWIVERGGVALWRSVDLGDPSASWCTPAFTDGELTPKPTWQAGNVPLVVTNAALVGVYRETLFQSIRVSLEQRGMKLCLTDGSQRKVDRALERCKLQHGNSHYRKGNPLYPTILVYWATDPIALPDFIVAQQETAT